MKLKKIGFLILLSILTHGLMAQVVAYGSNAQAGRYVNVGDAKIYYEVYGEGRPVLLLHGGLYGYINEFSQYIPVLSKQFKVIAMATRGHGRSEIGNEPFSYERYAKDVVKVLRNESPDSAVVIGFSDGAITAYLLAAEYKDITRKVVALAGGIDSSGHRKEAFEGYIKEKPEDVERNAPDFVRERKKLMPEPDRWLEFVEKVHGVCEKQVIVSKDEARKIKCPVLTVGGDRDDYFKTEQFFDIYNTIPHSQLAIIPNCDHVGLIEKPMVFKEIVLPFILQ